MQRHVRLKQNPAQQPEFVSADADAGRMAAEQRAQKFSNQLFILLSDLDGTIVPSYPNMAIAKISSERLPGRFKNAALRGLKRGTPEYTVRAAQLDEYFSAIQPHAKSGEPLSRVAFLFSDVGHGTILHNPYKAYQMVAERITADLTKMQVPATGRIAKMLGRTEPLFDPVHLRYLNTSLNAFWDRSCQSLYRDSHKIYDGYSEWLQQSTAHGLANAIFTNTDPIYATLKILRSVEHGHPINLSNLRRIYAFQDPKKVTHQIKWDGSDEDYRLFMTEIFNRATDSNEATAFVSQGRLRKVYDLMKPYKKGKPNPDPILDFVNEVGPEIEARVNADLALHGHTGEPFRISRKNIGMIGETKSDLDSTLSRDGNSIAVFYWQMQGVHQSVDTRNSDTIMRGSDHPHIVDWRHAVNAQSLGSCASHILPHGWKSMNYKVATDKLGVGMKLASPPPRAHNGNDKPAAAPKRNPSGRTLSAKRMRDLAKLAKN